MARDTRSGGSKDGQSAESSTTPKRKRRSSPSPAPPAPTSSTSLKVVLPSPSLHQNNTASSNTSPPNPSGGATHEHESKRQRISLRIGSGSNEQKEGPASLSVDKAEVADAIDEEDEGEVKASSESGHVLHKDLRAALALVISQMALNLPSPMNDISSLWLPPDFTEKEENTLGHVLRQESLTWESLVNLLHLFSENLLVPCSYPNPMPSLAQIHLPVLPLPSHYRPHAIYNFCAALHALLLEIEPRNRTDSPSAERWALMQKLPGNASSSNPGEWFTAAADIRMTEDALRKMKKDGKEVLGTLLETFAARGDKFGLANPVTLASAAVASNRPVPKLSETLYRRASLMMGRWKEARSKRQTASQGGLARAFQIPSRDTSWTPSFAPTYDSTVSKHGFYPTMDAMHERARSKHWARRALGRQQYSESAQHGWWGCLDGENTYSIEGEGKGRTVEDVLEDNEEWIGELHMLQELRVRSGEAKISDREAHLADTLLGSLTSLTGDVGASELAPSISSSVPGIAHELAQRFIPVSSPVVKGTLDPRRPRAIRENSTHRHGSGNPSGQTVSPQTSVAARSNNPNMTPGVAGKMPAPPPHIYRYQQQTTPSPPTNGLGQGPASAGPYRPPATASYSQYSPTGNALYSRPGISAVSSTQPFRPGPGPSSLRQSFGPNAGMLFGTPPGPGVTMMGAMRPTYPGGTPSRV